MRQRITSRVRYSMPGAACAMCSVATDVTESLTNRGLILQCFDSPRESESVGRSSR